MVKCYSKTIISIYIFGFSKNEKNEVKSMNPPYISRKGEFFPQEEGWLDQGNTRFLQCIALV